MEMVPLNSESIKGYIVTGRVFGGESEDTLLEPIIIYKPEP
jgi:hypothetical protein